MTLDSKLRILVGDVPHGPWRDKAILWYRMHPDQIDIDLTKRMKGWKRHAHKPKSSSHTKTQTSRG